MGNATCSVEGCEKPHCAKGYCAPHYKRVKAFGSPGSAAIRPRTFGGICSVDGCGRGHEAHGLCPGHLRRLNLSGDIGTEPLAERPGWVGDRAKYGAVHDRLRRERGLASGFVCSCGERAAEWAYDHAAENEAHDELGRAYSTDLSHYHPMCISCHRRSDAARSRNRKVS